MAKNVKLLLIENVDGLGIVGDVVNARLGYARNFLLPRGLATKPSDELVQQLAGKRAEAQRQVALLRKQREELIAKLQGVEIELVRPCNDQGILYGGITQQEVSAALLEKGFGVKPRDIRMNQAIKRIDSYEVHVKLDSDLDAIVKVHVKADRELVKDEPVEAAGQDEREERGGREDRGADRRQKKIDAIEAALAMAAAESNKKSSAAAPAEDGKKGKKGKKGD
jgi:large subunit ribosomal protein L9